MLTNEYIQSLPPCVDTITTNMRDGILRWLMHHDEWRTALTSLPAWEVYANCVNYVIFDQMDAEAWISAHCESNNTDAESRYHYIIWEDAFYQVTRLLCLKEFSNA